MKSFAKNIIALGMTSALSLSLGFLTPSYAATYELTVIDEEATENIGYTYGGNINNDGAMAISGTNFDNFPVQFEYLDDDDFDNIYYLALSEQNFYFGLVAIEDFDSLKNGNPTANDLSWTKIYLQNANESVENYLYQIVADSAALINYGDNSISTEICAFDTSFETPDERCEGELTRSTQTAIDGFTNTGITFGSGTAPYQPIDGPVINGEIQTHWVREHGQRGFYSVDFGATIQEITPIETRYGGGISAVFDINDNGTAVGFTSYKVSEYYEELVLDEESGGCSDPETLALIPYEVCVQNQQSAMYYIQGFKKSLSDPDSELEPLGLLIEPHEDDTRAFTSRALAINNDGVAVGYAHGWNSNTVTEPASNEPMTGSYAVMFKDGEVFDFNQTHYSFGAYTEFSRANDINNNGIAVGYTYTLNPTVQKFFYVDTSVHESEMEMVIPEGFFSSSVSSANAINSSGVIVGEAQIESHNDSSSNPRRTVGFMYDSSSNSPETIDLNTLLSCEAAEDMSIIKGNHINDSGQISATAVVKSIAYDALGNKIVDESGNPVFVDVVRAVLLDPIEGGEVESCGYTEDKVVRQGASLGQLIILSLFTLLVYRRKSMVAR